jgi:hypothetical protein
MCCRMRASICDTLNLGRSAFSARFTRLLRTAAQAHCTNVVLSQGAPLRRRLDRRLPALSSLRGQHTGPGDEVAFGREPAHVGADLGNDNLRTEIANAGFAIVPVRSTTRAAVEKINRS